MQKEETKLKLLGKLFLFSAAGLNVLSNFKGQLQPLLVIFISKVPMPAGALDASLELFQFQFKVAKAEELRVMEWLFHLEEGVWLPDSSWLCRATLIFRKIRCVQI